MRNWFFIEQLEGCDSLPVFSDQRLDFLRVVAESWIEPVRGSLMEILQKKLKRLKPCLSAFNKLRYANISKKVALKRKELDDLIVADESLFKQKSRIQ